MTEKLGIEEKVPVEEFKKTILKMYREFPNTIFVGEIEKVVVSSSMVEALIKGGYLVPDYSRENDKRIVGYFLGPAALPLVSSWKSEELAEKIRKLTYLLVTLTLILIGFGIISFVHL